MTDQHPITPPPELVQAFLRSNSSTPAGLTYEQFIATRFARWGADQELLACGDYLEKCAAWEPEDVTEFYNYRRPKPLSLKEQALETLRSMQIKPCWINGVNTYAELLSKYDILRRALEQLDD